MTSGIFGAGIPPAWARTLVDQTAFDDEQTRLAYVWTFLGFDKDAAKDGDWFRATLATRSVFVQRFGSELKGFENRCAHRSYPLRVADKGNGPIVCGFHHWRYDKDGHAVGIPMCQELFGATPREIGARLTQIDIATCGTLVFGRFRASHANESLEQFLGESFPILQAMSRWQVEPRYLTRTVKANWRLCFHISVDDYHIVAVHPTTFGKVGYLKRENIGYFRVGGHSAYFTDPDPQGVTKMAAACREGTWRSANYRVFHIFPNLTVAHFLSDRQHWFILVLQYVPIAKDRSLMRAWLYSAPFPAAQPWYERWIAPFTNPIRTVAVRYFANRVLSEDNEVCERLQTIAHQIDDRPILGALEERVAWFEETYAKAVSSRPGA